MLMRTNFVKVLVLNVVMTLLAVSSSFAISTERDVNKLSGSPASALTKAPAALNLMEVRTKIQYPTLAKEHKIQGQVIVKIRIDKDGIPTQHKVLNSAHPLLTEACMQQIYTLRFQPAENNGTPVNAWVTVPFRFQLDNNTIAE